MDKKIAVVTGVSRGIGSEIAQSLIEEGFYVIGSATSEAGVKKIDDALGENGTAFVLNLSSADSCQAFTASVLEVGVVSVLVNNAGMTQDNLLMRMKDEQWDDIIATNLTGTFRLTKLFLKGMMKQRWGRIINISSVVGTMGNPGQANYCASKAGVEGFTRSVAHELGSRSITSNAVAPGFIATDMTDELTQEQKDAMLSHIPLGRYGDPREIAGVVAFLASDKASYITGQVLHVNGGLKMG